MHRAVRRSDIGTKAHMVFHVAAGQFDFGAAFKFSKQIARLFAQGIDQHIQTASVRHTDDNLFHTVFTRILNQVVQPDNHALAAFDTEAFLTDVFGMQVAFQRFGGGQFFQDAAFLFGTVLRRREDALKIIAQPTALFGIRDVDVFQCEMAAISLFQIVDDVRQRHFVAAEEIALPHAELNGHVGIAQSVEFGVEGFDIARRHTFQRIKLGGTGTLYTVSRNQAQYADLFPHHRFVHAPRRYGFVLGQIGERFADGAVGDIDCGCTGLFRQIAEILLPFFIYGIGIFKELFVQLFNIGSV